MTAIDDLKEKTTQSFDAALVRLANDLAPIAKTVSSALLANVFVDFSGTPMRLSEVATGSVEDPKTMPIKIRFQSVSKEILRKVTNAGIGQVTDDGNSIVKLVVPPKTATEMPSMLAKLADSAKLSFRKTRDEAKDTARRLQADGKATAEDVTAAVSQFDLQIRDFASKIDDILVQKRRQLA